MDIHIARDGKEFGPFPLEEVQRQLTAGTLLPTDFAWTEGAAGWVPLASFPGVTVPPPGTTPPAPASVPPVPASVPAPAYQPAAGVPAYGAAPARPTATSGAAVASLVFGILAFILCPLVGNLVAVICGHIARGNIRNSKGALGGDGMAIAGLVLGYCGVVLVIPIMAGIALPVFSQVQIKAKETQSLSHAKQIATACQLYALDHGDAFPKTLDELVPDYLPDRTVFACPLSPGQPVGYDYFGGTSKDPATKVLLMSKFKDKHGKRIVARVDSSAALLVPPPDLSAPAP